MSVNLSCGKISVCLLSRIGLATVCYRETMASSHLKSELVAGLTAHRLFNDKIGIKLLREFELIVYYI